MSERIKAGDRFTHCLSGQVYVVQSVAYDASVEEHEVLKGCIVVYAAEHRPDVTWYRAYPEFDGPHRSGVKRFVRIDASL